MLPTVRVACLFSTSISAVLVGVCLGACKEPAPAPAPAPAPTPTPEPAPAPAPAPAPVADAASLPTEPAAFVDIKRLDDSIKLDMRYATERNFAKRAVYKVATCKLRLAVAERVVQAQAALRGDGFGLKIWDCYRPFRVQEDFWKLVPDPRYVAKPMRKNGAPHKGSKHNRGAAIDVTLVKADGTELPMPTDHDDFSPRAGRASKLWTAEQRAHSERLTKALKAAGFTTISSEWWHFDGPDWRDYPLADEPL